MSRLRYALVWSLALVPLAFATEVVLVEDWSAYPLGTRGIPSGWQRQSWGKPAYDFTIIEDEGRRALHMKSQNENSTITKDIRGRVNLRDTPILEWSWKAVTLPKGGDARHGEADDQVAQVYVTWPRFPEALRSRIIGYVWDTTAPVGTIVKSEKTRTVTYVVVRSGAAGLGQWLSEQRNVWEDYKTIYGEEPDNPGVISVAINTNNTKSVAEAFLGEIVFRNMRQGDSQPTSSRTASTTGAERVGSIVETERLQGREPNLHGQVGKASERAGHLCLWAPLR